MSANHPYGNNPYQHPYSANNQAQHPGQPGYHYISPYAQNPDFPNHGQAVAPNVPGTNQHPAGAALPSLHSVPGVGQALYGPYTANASQTGQGAVFCIVCHEGFEHMWQLDNHVLSDHPDHQIAKDTKERVMNTGRSINNLGTLEMSPSNSTQLLAPRSVEQGLLPQNDKARHQGAVILEKTIGRRKIYTCSGCFYEPTGGTFGAVQRHLDRFSPPQYFCNRPMCERGIRGFTRKDEVEQHRRHEHGVDARWDAGFHG